MGLNLLSNSYFFVFGINLGTKMVANMDNNVYLYGVNIKVYRSDLTSSLIKYVFYNWLINNILYLRVT